MCFFGQDCVVGFELVLGQEISIDGGRDVEERVAHTEKSAYERGVGRRLNRQSRKRFEKTALLTCLGFWYVWGFVCIRAGVFLKK